MLTVDEYGQIRRAHRDGRSIRAIARTLHHSRRKVREALACPEPRPYTRTKDPPALKLGPFKPIIEEILKTDENAPRKQRHTAAQIFRRLRSEHDYVGGYDQVRRYVGRQRRDQRETFIPLVHDPGQRLECDFGHIYVDFPEGRQRAPVLIPTWAYSYCPFAMALPTERTEAILAGMVEAFAFFDCVPREVWWDNPRTVATAIFKGRSRKLNERYAALASHYAFEPLFCMPARGNEKPHTENRVFDLQRRWATPVPKVRDLAELNAYLRACCLKEGDRTVAGQTETIGVRFERERAAADPLPARAFDACVPQEAKVDKYQTVRFDDNRYSTPRNCAFRAVTIKGYTRSTNALRARIKAAAFPVHKDFDTYDFTAIPTLTKPKILELARGEWIDEHANCCLIGNVGTGKTHVATALGLAARRRGRRVRFFTAANLVNRLEEAQKQYQLDRFLTQLDKTDLLICDELGYLSFSRAGAELLFQVFADRYERASLLITSNLAFSDWGQVFKGERMTAALLDRLTHRCHIFEMNGESYRFRESMKGKKSSAKHQDGAKAR